MPDAPARSGRALTKLHRVDVRLYSGVVFSVSEVVRVPLRRLNESHCIVAIAQTSFRRLGRR